MVIASVVEETHGVLRYQIVQTAPAALTIRFDEFLHAQGAAAVTVNPLRSPTTKSRNGKLKHVVRALPTTPAQAAEGPR